MSVQNFWTWQSAITSSDLEPVTRHVLLTIATFMNSQNTAAFPSQEKLAECTGLGKRTIVTHIKKAVDAGYLKVQKHGYAGQKWANNEYVATMPPEDKVVHMTTQGSAYDDKKVVREMHLNTQYNTPLNKPEPGLFEEKKEDTKTNIKDLFEPFWKGVRQKLPPDVLARTSKKDTIDQLSRKAKEGSDPQAIINAVRFMLTQHAFQKDNYKFVPALNRLIRDEKYEPYLGRTVDTRSKSERERDEMMKLYANMVNNGGSLPFPASEVEFKYRKLFDLKYRRKFGWEK